MSGLNGLYHGVNADLELAMIIGTFSVLMLTALANGFVLFVSYFIISKIFKSGKKAVSIVFSVNVLMDIMNIIFVDYYNKNYVLLGEYLDPE